jgi:hypothetical protein
LEVPKMSADSVLGAAPSETTEVADGGHLAPRDEDLTQSVTATEADEERQVAREEDTVLADGGHLAPRDADLTRSVRTTEAAVDEEETEDVTEEETVLAEDTLTPALSQREREQGAPTHTEAAERIRASDKLPAGLRDRVATLIEACGSTAEGEARATFDEAIRAVEEALPSALRVSERGVAQPDHPAGETFFSGAGEELSDAQAEAIARGQLVRSGMLRGQRARVAV